MSKVSIYVDKGSSVLEFTMQFSERSVPFKMGGGVYLSFLAVSLMQTH